MDIFFSGFAFEILRAAVLIVLLIVVYIKGRKTHIARSFGAKAVFLGFVLIFFATLLDITNENIGLERFVITGETPEEAVLEELFGYLPGFLLILFGLTRLIPVVAASERNIRQLRESENRFYTIFDTIPDVVAITRLADGTVVNLNHAYDTLTGYRREDIIGRSSIEMGSWVNPADRETMIEGVRENGFVRDLEAPMLSSDGQVRDSLVSARMLVLNNEPHLLTIFKDITERKKFVRALEESEKRFRGIFESNPDPVILSRLANGETIDVNKAFEVATGISRAEALGRTSEDMGLWLDPEQRVLTLERLRANGSIDNMEAVFKVRGGANKVGLLSARVINLNNEPCLLFVIRDISREKEAERALFEMDQMKNEFISTAAHELRTPLSTIMGYTELLMEPESFGGFTEEQKLEFHEVIYDKGEALIKIVDDLLDISRIESGHPVSLDFQDVDVRALLIKVINVFKISSGKHDYQIDLSRLEENCVLSIDRQRITQVLENLISNAVKYSPKGRRIIVRGESVREGLCVTVQDQGNGMTGEQVARIFDKFYRADASDTAVGGLGLGMSIARQIVEAHNGRIWVESTPGEGTKASFILPKA